MPPSFALAGKPIRLSIPCAGVDPGGTVSVKVFEPHGLGGDPLDTFDANVDEPGVAKATWTYDHAKLRDKVSRASFIFVVEGAGRVSASAVLDFLDRFRATVKDAAGKPAAWRVVVLHADRGENVETATDGQGKVDVLVPPGDYHVELKGPLPPDRIPAVPPASGDEPETPGADEDEAEAAEAPDEGAADESASEDASAGGAFTDLEWTASGSTARLEAKTTLPDGDCTFTVYKCDASALPSPPPDSSGGGEKPEPGTVLGTAAGKIAGGVASADWTPPQGYDPFDHDAWLVDHDLDVRIATDEDHDADGSFDDLLAKPALEPPVFVVESGDAWACSGPPGVRLNKIAITGKDDVRGTALTADGRLVAFQASGGKIEAEDHVVVVSLFFGDGFDVQPAGAGRGAT